MTSKNSLQLNFGDSSPNSSHQFNSLASSTNKIDASNGHNVASRSSTPTRESLDTRREFIPAAKHSSQPRARFLNRHGILVAFLLITAIGALFSYGITWFWKIDRTFLPICPNTGDWIDSWQIAADILESLYFGSALAFTLTMGYRIMRMEVKLIRRILPIFLGLSFFMLSWFWHGRLHYSFCGYWSTNLLNIFFHVPVALFSIMMMRFCLLMLNNFLGINVRRHSNDLSRALNRETSKKEKIAVVIGFVLATIFFTFASFYWFGNNPATLPTPVCGMEPGCPYLPCQIPAYCTDYMCPELATQCPMQDSVYTADQCYGDGVVNPVTNVTNPDHLTSTCTTISETNNTCFPAEGISYSQCASMTYEPEENDSCQTNSSTPNACMAGQIPSTVPVALPQCNMNPIENLCLVCKSYRNYAIQTSRCYASFLDKDQMPWTKPTTVQTVMEICYMVFDAAMFVSSIFFLCIALPRAWRVKSRTGLRWWLVAFVLAVAWNTGSWMWHNNIRRSIPKPMPAMQWVAIVIGFQWSVMLSSMIIVIAMSSILNMSYRYSRSQFRKEKKQGSTSGGVRPSIASMNRTPQYSQSTSSQSFMDDGTTGRASTTLCVPQSNLFEPGITRLCKRDEVSPHKTSHMSEEKHSIVNEDLSGDSDSNPPVKRSQSGLDKAKGILNALAKGMRDSSDTKEIYAANMEIPSYWSSVDDSMTGTTNSDDTVIDRVSRMDAEKATNMRTPSSHMLLPQGDFSVNIAQSVVALDDENEMKDQR
eukprot:CFRG1844T1